MILLCLFLENLKNNYHNNFIEMNEKVIYLEVIRKEEEKEEGRKEIKK